MRRELFGRLTREQRLRRQVADVLVGCGFFEAYTYSLQADDPHPDALVLPEPLSELQRVLRTNLLHGLIGAARHNVNVGKEDVALFEIAHVYLPTGEKLPEEPWHLGGIVRGGFYRAKGAVEQVFAALKLEPRFERAPHPFMPSPACAPVDGGWVAQLDPRRLEGEWSAFELDLAELFAHVPERVLYEDVITYPPVRQDLAFSVPEEVSAGELVDAAREAAGPELREVRAFDVYHGEQVGRGGSRSRSRSRSSRPSGRSRRGRSQAARAHRRGAGRAVRSRVARVGQACPRPISRARTRCRRGRSS